MKRRPMRRRQRVLVVVIYRVVPRRTKVRRVLETK